MNQAPQPHKPLVAHIYTADPSAQADRLNAFITMGQ
ncbi:hypothetical protein B0G52_102138 [Cohnella sp. SGD-V74]|jgi:hypothetical protein|nr:hypothetical protein B0G52_102138 [Cohnella sp. SGD-V74]